MGDRANLTLKYRNGGEVNVYVHWHGSALPIILAKALARKERWDDESYLARIIISEIAKAVGVDDSTGMGIMPTNDFGEGGPVVNLAKQTVTLREHWGGDDSPQWFNVVSDGEYTFSEYIALHPMQD